MDRSFGWDNLIPNISFWLTALWYQIIRRKKEWNYYWYWLPPWIRALTSFKPPQISDPAQEFPEIAFVMLGRLQSINDMRRHTSLHMVTHNALPAPPDLLQAMVPWWGANPSHTFRKSLSMAFERDCPTRSPDRCGDSRMDPHATVVALSGLHRDIRWTVSRATVGPVRRAFQIHWHYWWQRHN